MYRDIESSIKTHNNELIVTYCKNYLTECTGALVLDGPEARTTNALLNNGIVKKRKTVHVPQNDERDYREIKKRNICKVKKCSIGEYIEKMDEKDIQSINLCYFDYMGCISGNKTKDTYPLEDMCSFLTKSTQDKIVFACTFSRRAKKPSFISAEEYIIGYFLKQLFIYSQRKIIDSQIISYSGSLSNRGKQKSVNGKGSPMLFCLFVLERDLTIDPTNVTFICNDDGYIGYRPSIVDLDLFID
jgi:hypothetical protein